jgi:hypothetical protein
MPRERSWTDDDLRRAVAEAEQWKDVGPALGLHKSAGSEIRIRVRIAELGLDISHLEDRRRRDAAARARARRRGESTTPDSSGGSSAGGSRQRGPRWDADELRTAVDGARSYAEVLRRLGCRPGGSTYVQLKREIAEAGIDTSHMKGRRWAEGRSFPEMSRRRSRPLEEILVADSDYLNTHRLRKRLLREGLKDHRCEICGRTEWNGEPIPLQLDHINGDRRDNRMENIRLVCPNCHAQTDTWCGKNIGRYDDDG